MRFYAGLQSENIKEHENYRPWVKLSPMATTHYKKLYNGYGEFFSKECPAHKRFKPCHELNSMIPAAELYVCLTVFLGGD
jgi:hypothetical protein